MCSHARRARINRRTLVSARESGRRQESTIACVAQTGSPESRGSITPQSRSPVAWAAGLVMGLLAVAGWGAFAYGNVDQQRLSEQAAGLRASREQLAEEYVKALEQLAAAQNEVVMLRSQVARLQSQSV